LINSNSGNVLIGDFSNIPVSSGLLYSYYKFSVSGRTNFIGNDNVIGIWSATPYGNKRHYLGISNATYGAGADYTSITSTAWDGVAETPQALTFQNFQDPSGTGNVGIGYFPAAPTAKLSVNGQVFVNTSCAPSDAQLAVNGRIYATSVKVELPDGAGCFPDYVFEAHYKLRPLLELESYIKFNKHLPDVPSATQVEANGIDIAEMDAILLRKVEELTLYMIELKKENAQLVQEIEALKDPKK